MITCQLMGGLGNQLFQIFHTIACAIRSSNNFIFLNIYELDYGTTKRYTYWDSLLSSLKPYLMNNIPEHKTINEIDFMYHEISKDLLSNNNILLFGYFQSYKYFETYYSTIYKLLDLNKNKINLLKEVNKYEDDSITLKNTISLHFRIGDYKNIQNFHPIMSYDYYKNSLNYFKEYNSNIDYNIIYFCEDKDIETVIETVQKLKSDFPNYSFDRCKIELQDWEQLIYMSCCEHNIIANSTFSWWGAYFNAKSDKIVCYPSLWFGKDANVDVSDLCPKNWIKIEA